MIYLDNAATTKISEEARSAYREAEEEFFANPSSLHSAGIKARKKLESEREEIAANLKVSPSSLIFTSGATEAVSLVFSSLLKTEPSDVIISSAEHSAVLSWKDTLSFFGWNVILLKARDGFVDKEELVDKITKRTKLIALMSVNNVTGAINNIREISLAVRKKEEKRHIHILSDCAQALGKIDMSDVLPFADSASFSAHKINGPRGCGMLYIKNRDFLSPLSQAGGQEGGKRGGTENLPAISAFRASLKEWMDSGERERIKELNTLLRISLSSLGLKVLSPSFSSPYILSFSTSSLPSEVFVRMLSEKGICVSAGSACSSNAKSDQGVLNNMGFARESKNAVRVSFSNESTKEEVDSLISAIKEIING